MTKDEALSIYDTLTLALECAERCEAIDGMYSWSATITAIKEALSSPNGEAQPEQKPVAWPVEEQPDGSVIPIDPSEMTAEQLQRYITPPQRTWVGLTDEEVNELVEHTECEDYYGLVEATEAKLKEKNT